MKPLMFSIVLFTTVLTLRAAEPFQRKRAPTMVPDSFQRQYGSDASYADPSPRFQEPSDSGQEVTVGYLKAILDRLENEIFQLRKTVKEQRAEILELKLSLMR